VSNNSKIPEELLYKIWEERRLNESLTTSEGIALEIIDSGVKNNDVAGPDYHNARIRIGNITFTGDIEIDPLHSDWKSHGHHLNQRYDKVILHAVLSNDSSYPFVVTSSGRKVPTLELQKFLSSSIKEKLTEDLKDIKNDDNIKMPCKEINSKIDRKEKLDFIRELGLLRFRKKCEKNIERLKELIVLSELKLKEPKVYHDFHQQINSREFNQKEFEPILYWEQLLYEQLFEALGYSKNKDIMLKLSKAVEMDFLKGINNISVDKIEGILLNISGLIPELTAIPDEETSTYLRKALDDWNEVKSYYDSKTFNKNDWHFFKLRPQNFPTVRLAAGAKLVHKIISQNLFERLKKILIDNSQSQKIISNLRNEFIIKGEGYWASHFNFNKNNKTRLNYFIGVGRADEIIINIIFPIFSVYFEIHNQKEQSKKILDFYTNFYQKEGNHLVDQVNDVLGFNKEKFRSVYYQGMIDLFRNYCIKQKCLQCEIGKKVFTS
jgi:hypothetical protein